MSRFHNEEEDPSSPTDISNPFHIPTDEEVFVLRDEEKRLRKQEKARMSKMPVHEKATWSTRLTVKRYKGGIAESKPQGTTLPKLNSKNPELTSTQEKTQKKENMNEFIEKKRKMFLLQMELDTKKFEIKKLEQKAEERERKLAAEEAALAKDAHRFDDFLTENDINAVEAINRADEEQKKKSAKQQEIKKLNARIQAINTEIAKLDEQLANCEKYKEFLDNLTPENWKTEQKNKIKDKILNENPNLDPSQVVVTDADIDVMYFQDPQKLLNIFSELEAKNLFLIQTSQEVEEQLEELRKVKRQTEEKMEKQARNLEEQIIQLEYQIENEKDKEYSIKSRTENYFNSENELRMDKLKEKIKDIYIAAKLDIPSTGIDMEPLQMLTKIETRLDKMLETIEQYDQIDKDFVKKMERQLEKDRRKALRDQRNFGQATSQRRKPTEKSEDVDRKISMGKPLMFRSKPEDKKKKKQKKKKENSNQTDKFHELFFS